MKLIFAQGNPEARFDGTRHSVGFAILDTFVAQLSGIWSDKPKFHALIAELTINGEKILFAKPTTYYNETGQSARALIDFYKLDAANDLLVIHDDLALPIGLIRVREKGSDAGNNGIKSLNAHLDEHYHRLRIGIMSDQHYNDLDFVLGKFTQLESEQLVPVIDQAVELIDNFITGTLEITSHDLGPKAPADTPEPLA